MTIKQQGGIFGRNPTFNEVDVQTNVSFSDNAKALFGNSSDLAVYHNGSNSIIEDTGSGNLYIQGTHVYIKDASGNNFARFYDNGTGGQIRLYHDASKVFETNSSGISITGNVAVTSGNGIDFSATSGTGTSELFDDYEEGTWSPVLSDANSGGNTATLGSSTAHYVKVGSVVHLFLQVINVNNSGMTGGNTLYIQGLPYTSVSSNNSAGSAVFDRVSVLGFDAVTPAIGPNRDYMTLATTFTGAADANLTVAAFNNTASDIQNLTISYRA